ncbi:tetratricopeptide repeat protein [Roseivirga sp.]|uniref:tetratricopeptide repeat protein n=1 Tax=Roseivirga sp. TaxID=1964215 RepID=UPI003B8C248B
MKLLTNISLTLILLIALGFQGNAQRKKKGAEENLKEETTPYEMANAEYLLIEAQKFFLLEDYKRALAFLDQSIEVDPDNHAAHFKAAEIHLILQQNTDGLIAIDKAIEIQQDNKYYYVLAAQLQKASNDFKGAAVYYELMMANTTGYSSYLIEITRVYEEIGDFKKGIDILDKAEQQSEGLSFDQKFRKVDLLIKANEANKALKYLGELNDQNPNNSNILFRYASALSNSDKIEKAISALEASNLNTNDLKLLLAENYLKAGMLDKQKDMLLAVYNDDEANLSIKTLLLGQWAFSSNLLDNVALIDSLQIQLEIDYPNEAIALENGGLIYSKVAQVTSGTERAKFELKAIKRYKNLTEISPGNFEVWQKVLAFEYNNNKWQDLANDAEEALDLFPNQVVFYVYLAKANQGLEEFSEAQSLLRQALRMTGSNQILKSQVIGKQAELALAQGNTEQAITLFDQSISTDPPHPESLASYANYLSKNDPQKAIQLIDPLLISSFKNLSFIRIKASALFNLADYTGAYEVLNQGLAEYANEKSGLVLELLGDTQFKLNRIEEALINWKEAKRLGGTSEKIDQKIENKQYN